MKTILVILILLQYFYNTFTILLQYFYNTFTLLLQYFYNTFTILLQYFHNTFTILISNFNFFIDTMWNRLLMENALIFYKLCLIFHRCIPFLCAGGSVYPLEFWDQNSSQSASSLLPSPLWLPPLPALPQKPWSNRLGQPLQFCWWSAFRCLRGCRKLAQFNILLVLVLELRLKFWRF